MMKRILLLLLCVTSLPLSAQRITRQYRDVSMADALKELNTLQSKYVVNFIYDDLEDFRISTTVQNKPVPDAIRQIIGFYPIMMTQQGSMLMVECTHKAGQKYTGRIVDGQGRAVEFANVALLTADSQTFIAGGVTNADGRFVIPSDVETALVRVSYVGYKTVVRRASGPYVGTIRLDEDQLTLQGVSITEIRPTVTYKADRYVVNIRNSILGTGNTAHSLLTQLPGVWLNGTSISINGIEGTRVMVNDRDIKLSGDLLIGYLKTIRSEEIESIEIISNPPAEFEAQGMGGYLRIITRQRQPGSQLTVGATADIINYNAAKPQVYYSYSKGRFGFDASANGTFGKGYLRADELTKDGNALTNYDNRITDRMDDAIYSLNTNLYYDIDDRNKLMLNLNHYHWYKDEHLLGNTWITRQPTPTVTQTDTRHETIQNDNEWSTSLNYTRLYGPNDKHKLLVMADLAQSHYPVKDYLTYDNYAADGRQVSEENFYHINQNPFTIASTEARNSWNMERTGTLTAGAKYSHSQKSNRFDSHELQNDTWQQLPEQSYDLKYKEDLLAGYLKYELSTKKWSITAGLRGEYNQATAEGYDFSYHHFDLFPTLYYSFHPNARHRINASAARRTQRVSFSKLLPYRYYHSRYTISTGNPLLRPDYSNHLELVYILLNKYNLSLNYVWSNNGTESYNHSVNINGQPLTAISYVDGVRSRYFNVNLYIPVRVSARWSMTNQLRLNTLHFRTSETRVNSLRWSIYTQQTIILPWNIRFQLLYRYLSKSKSAYGTTDGYHVLNTSWMKTFCGDRLTCKLSIDDWLWAQKPRTTVNNGAIYQESRMYGRQVPSFSLSVVYTISKGKLRQHNDIEQSNQEEKQRAR